jgi:hypothetical protein
MTEVELKKALRFLVQGIDDLGMNPQELLEKFDQNCREELWERYQNETIIVSTPTGPSVIQNGNPTWREKFNTANGPLWANLYEHLLVDKQRSETEIASLDQASDEILFRLNDPFIPAESNNKKAVKGLVVGFVQSGKTANYTAMAAKAFDAGFKIVIVLTGIHNALRRQTQIRMNNELGIALTTENRQTTLKSGDPSIHAMTGEDLLTGDFRYSNISNTVLASGRFLFVTKKNKSVLSNLNNWLDKAALNQPTLIIDDEADQASINTGGNKVFDILEDDEDAGSEDLNPTAINKEIRLLVDKFAHVSYVGYTATPYANVFIKHDAQDYEAKDDLYPSDFIVSLAKPQGYMGPEEFFGSSVTEVAGEDPSLSDKVIQIVPEEEITELKDLVQKYGNDPAYGLPKSLQNAVRDFLLGTSLRRLVDGKIAPSAVLIHTTRLAAEQLVLKNKVESYLSGLRANWRYNTVDAKLEWETYWEEYIAKVPDGEYKLKFQDIELKLAELIGQFSPLPVKLLNSKSDDELDYELDPNLTAIVVGGNKLSRGLTIEGLIVSYFVRESSSPNADTLTQMGRFFGYKSDLVAVTRIYTTDQLRSDFRDVSLMESSLRREIQLYALSGKTPRDFGPRVVKRVGLSPTSKNKMKDAKSYDISYSGDLVQTTSFPKYGDKKRSTSESKIEVNLKLATNFLETVDKDYKRANIQSPNRILWKDVDSRSVAAFLEEYQGVENATRFRPELITRYISDMVNIGELSKMSVAVIGRQADDELGTESFGLGLNFGRVARSLDKGSDVSIGSLITPLNFATKTGDELIDMSDGQLQQALKYIDEFELSPVNAVRTARTPHRGLLLIYPISPSSVGSETSTGKRSDISLGKSLEIPTDKNTTIVGLSLVFPNSDQDQTSRKYWVGTAGQNDQQ